jgi:hypothetical protein
MPAHHAYASLAPYLQTVRMRVTTEKEVVILVSVATSVSGTLDWRRWLVLGPDRPGGANGRPGSEVMNIALPSAQRAPHFIIADRQWEVAAYTRRSAACCCPAADWPTCSAARSRPRPGWLGSPTSGLSAAPQSPGDGRSPGPARRSGNSLR